MNFHLSEKDYNLNETTRVFSRLNYTGIAYNDGNEVEIRIADIIEQAGDVSTLSGELRQQCTDWPSLYHLSGIRANILRPFEDDLRGNILEIGAGCGAITRYLGECGGNVLALEGSPRRAAITRSRTRDLANVTVLAEKFDDFTTNHKFDILTLIGVLEYANLFTTGEQPALTMLERAKKLLKPSGKLFIAIENQLGLKYFAGAPEDHVGESMYGLERRYRKDQPQTFGRKNLEQMLENAGFAAIEFLVPFPDYKLPVSIITKAGFSARNFDATTLASQSTRRDPQLPAILAFSPELVWPAIISNELALDLANSFLIVATQTQNSILDPSILAWHFTTDRKREFCKKTLFVKLPNNEIEVRYKKIVQEKPVVTSDKLLKFKLAERDTYIYGTPLSQELIRIVTRDGWQFCELHQFFKKYFNILAHIKGEHKPIPEQIHFDTVLPGTFFDYIPQNIIISTDGTAHLIDKEWELTQPLQTGYLVFRSLLNLFSSISKLGHPDDEFTKTHIGFILAATNNIYESPDENLIEQYVNWEAAIQTEVTGRTVTAQELMEWLNNPISIFDNLSQAVTKKDAQIANLNQLLNERNLRNLILERIYASKSWRLTHPLRLFFSTFIRLQRYAKPSSLQAFIRNTTDRLKNAAFMVARQIYRALPVKQQTKYKLRSTLHFLIRRLRCSLSNQTQTPFPLPSKHPIWPAVQERDVFIFSIIDWHFRIQRPQQMAYSLAKKGQRVFYFNNTFVASHEPGYQIKQIEAERPIFIVTLHADSAPSIYFEAPSQETLGMLKASIACFLFDFTSVKVTAIVQHAFWYPLVQCLPNTWRIYDCMDFHEGFGKIPQQLVEIEHNMLQQVDLVITTSTWLKKSALDYNQNVALVRNAGDYNHFSDRPAEVYVDARRRRIIGYIGAIAEWFDVDLIRSIAQQYSNCLILLIGNDTIGAQRVLSDLPNVVFVGEVPYTRLPYYLHAFDVSLLPFKVIPLTLATNPVKVYEYLAAGKAVVCVDLPEIVQFEKLVWHAANHEDFIEYVGEALLPANNSISIINARKAFAQKQTWDHRTDELQTALDTLSWPKISVIVLTYNNLHLTKDCLYSVLEKSDYPNLEIIIIDNASTDATSQWLRTLREEHPAIKIIFNDRNLGFAKGNNIGLAAASGDFLALLNNDTVVTRGWALTLMRHLQNDPSIGIICPVTNNIGNEAKIDISYNTLKNMPRIASHYTLQHLGQYLPIRTTAFFCAMMSRKTYELVGPLDEAYGRGFFEDDDYCRRIEQLGLHAACAEDVFIHHHLSASFNTLKQQERQKLFDENKKIYEEKWGKWVPHSYRH